MPFSYQIELRFYPVGQGLFAFGQIKSVQSERCFRWVYDCGTASSQSLITGAIDDLCESFGSGKQQVDLVVLSHFDRDHISGLVKLLKKCSVKTLLLPYVPLWQRLIVAFNAGVSCRSQMMRFLVNPVAYLSRLQGVDVEQILFVPEVRPGDRAPDEGNDRASLDGHSDEHGEDNLIINEVPESECDEEWLSEIDVVTAQVRSPCKVSMLRGGSALIWGGCWEFVPYNDTHIISSRRLKCFQNYVQVLRGKLLRSESVSTSKELLDQIKIKYQDFFGTSSKERNIISLFLYVGQCPDSSFGLTHVLRKSHGEPRLIEEYWTRPAPVRIIYTGDGYLNTTARIDSFIGYMGRYRVSRLLCFQVMHHGSRANWCVGLANILQPRFSVFSSDPAHKKFQHPHGEVVRDFIYYGPTQVDKYHDLMIKGYVM